jgi:hypothetical protein
MRHLLFAASFGAALGLVPTAVNAQSVPPGMVSRSADPVPGRALLDFPLGTLGEVPALATAAGGGLFNPAAILANAPARVRASIADLRAQGERGADGQAATVAVQRGRSAFGVSFARMEVSGLDRTGDDGPVVLGQIRYDTYVASAVAARRIGGPLHQRLAIGLAARYRGAHSDTIVGGTGAFDLGAVVDRLGGKLDGRVAIASYLWHPGRESVERPGLHVGADARVYGRGAEHEARVGIARDATRGGTTETGFYASGRWRFAEARGGIATARDFGESQSRTRLALGFHAERLTVGVGREDSNPGLGAIYQFTLSTRIR